MSITVSGITPKQISGNNILIDESGSFTVSQSIIATIYLAGGGCDGGDGNWHGNIIDETLLPVINSGSGTSHSGKGGDGGFINVFTNVRINENKLISVNIADRNNQTGTSMIINGKLYSCSSLGSCREGGKGGEVPLAKSGEPYTAEDRVKLPGKGSNGVTSSPAVGRVWFSLNYTIV